jgi:hypothetical protein
VSTSFREAVNLSTPVDTRNGGASAHRSFSGVFTDVDQSQALGMLRFGAVAYGRSKFRMKSIVVEVEKKMPIFVFDISERTDVLRSAEIAVMEEYEKNPKPRRSNVSAHFVSSYEGDRDNRNFSPLVELTLDCIAEVAKSHYGLQAKFKCSNCWGAIYKPGDSARLHHHFPYDFAVVCYLKVDEGAAPLVFEETCEIQPKAGSLVVFSGLLNHHVPPTHSGRTVVGMNFRVAPSDPR